jgi:TetR/AcrR family transcriptional repressor of nem operon
MSPRSKEFDQDLVIEKAMELFSEKGYAATSIRDLVSYLEISSSSLYNAFGGKDALFFLALRRHSQLGRKGLRKALESEDDPRQILSKLFSDLIDSLLANQIPGGSLAFKASVELENQKPEVAAILSEHYQDENRILTEFLTHAAEKGQINLRHPAQDIACYIQFNILTLDFLTVKLNRACLENYVKIVLSVLD